jgi:hypothetical protein
VSIERSIIALKIPGSHAEQAYQLRQHLKFVHSNLGATVRDVEDSQSV